MEKVKKKVLLKFPFQKESRVTRGNKTFFANQTNRGNSKHEKII